MMFGWTFADETSDITIDEVRRSSGRRASTNGYYDNLESDTI